MMQNAPELGQDVIDSRDVIERIEELGTEPEREGFDGVCTDEAGWNGAASAAGEGETWWLCSDHATELAQWRELAGEGEVNSADWRYGETLILDSYFEDYARELAKDIGAIPDDAGWPVGFIDWPRAAEALQMDYTMVSAGGYDYWVR